MRRTAIVGVMLSCLVGRPAFAEEDVERQAGIAFEEGSRLFEADDYTAALVKFREAYSIRPHDLARIPIATCLERLARFREAIAEWQVVASSDAVDAAQQKEARAAIERLKPRLATVAVTGTPAGAEVVIDGESRCALPCTAEVDPGERVVIVRKDGLEQTKRVQLSRGGAEAWEVRLTSSPAVAPPVASPPLPAEPDAPGRGPGVMTWVGLGVTAVGGAGILGFGLRARAKHDDYEAQPSDELRDDGLLARNLTNASIGVAAAGAVLALIDLVFLAPQPATEEQARLGPQGFTLSF